MHLTTYLRLLATAEGTLGDSYGAVAAVEQVDAEVHFTCPPGLDTVRRGPIGLLRDLQDLYQLANLVEITWVLVGQAAHGARDRDLIDLATRGERDLHAQLAWLRTRLQVAAPQTLLVAS